MDILDGIFDYNFAIKRGKIVHYYEVIANNKSDAVKKAEVCFKREYGAGLFRKMVIEDNVIGYPLTKM